MQEASSGTSSLLFAEAFFFTLCLFIYLFLAELDLYTNVCLVLLKN